MNKPPDSECPELRCPECAYNLFGLTSDRCPSCGWDVDVQELIAENISRKGGARLSVAATALIVGLCSSIGLLALYTHSRELGWRDALAVLNVSAVALSHIALAAVALRSSHRWPMQKGELANILRLVGWGSIAAAIVSATSLLSAAPNRLIVKGVQVNGILEFVVTAIFFSLPGTLLLILRMVSFRHPFHRSRMNRTGAESSNKPPFNIEADQRYSLDQLLQVAVELTRTTVPAVEELISRTWEVESVMAQEEGRSLYNGQIARLRGIEKSPASLKLFLSRTCYRDFLGTNLLHAAEVTRLHPDSRSDPLGISGLITTSDGYLVLGVRSRRVFFHAEHAHTFGGLVEEEDRTASGYDLPGSLFRELREEVKLNQEEIARAVVSGLVRDRVILQPELIFEVTLRIASSNLKQRFDAQTDLEHSEWLFIADDPDELVHFIRSHSKVTPVAQAALLLHGKHSWGTDWYQKAMIKLYGQLPTASSTP